MREVNQLSTQKGAEDHKLINGRLNVGKGSGRSGVGTRILIGN